MRLNSEEILRRIKDEGLITNGDPEQVDANHIEGGVYDLRVGRVFKPDYPHGQFGEMLRPFVGTQSRRTLEAQEVEPFYMSNSSEVGWGLESGFYYLIQTIEEIDCPSDIVPHIEAKRTLIQNGMFLNTAHTAPGFKGQWMFGLLCSFRCELYRGARVAGMVFETTMKEKHLYDGIWKGDTKDSGGERRSY